MVLIVDKGYWNSPWQNNERDGLIPYGYGGVMLRKGATLYISYNGGQITDFPLITGSVSKGVMDKTAHTAQLGNATFAYTGKEILLDPTTAQVIARNDAGNPVMLKNSVGKGAYQPCCIPFRYIILFSWLEQSQTI